MAKFIRCSFGISAALVAMGALLSGCGAAESDAGLEAEVETAASEPLALVKIDDQRVVRFYELPEGGVVITASTDSGAVLAQDEYDLRGTAEEVFSRLRPGEAVPAVLKAADARQALLTAERGAIGKLQSETVSSPDVTAELISKDPTDAWFQSWACQTSILQHATTGQSVNACLLNRTNGGTTAVTRVWEGAGSAYSWLGTITFKTKFRNSGTSSWINMDPRPFPAGLGGTNWVWHQPSIPIDITFEVADAAGDGYHRAVVTGIALPCGPNNSCFIGPGGTCNCPR